MITCLEMTPLKNVAIILGYTNPDYNKLKITFVAYAQVFIGNNNSTKI